MSQCVTDEPSARGRYTHVAFKDSYIPCVLKSDGTKYVSVRIVEKDLLDQFLKYVSVEVYTCCRITSYAMSDREADLLTRLNYKLKFRYGQESFLNDSDFLVKYDDFVEFYKFLEMCYRRLVLKAPDVNDRCGFVRIGGDSVVPYIVKDGIRYVPIFYFEGETENLKSKGTSLKTWDLAYLKFCCKVQGIKNELFQSDECLVTSLENVKAYFPADTKFEDYWPKRTSELDICKNSTTRAQSWAVVQYRDSLITTHPPVGLTNGTSSVNGLSNVPVSSAPIPTPAPAPAPRLLNGIPTTLTSMPVYQAWPNPSPVARSPFQPNRSTLPTNTPQHRLLLNHPQQSQQQSRMVYVQSNPNQLPPYNMNQPMRPQVPAEQRYNQAPQNGPIMSTSSNVQSQVRTSVGGNNVYMTMPNVAQNNYNDLFSVPNVRPVATPLQPPQYMPSASSSMNNTNLTSTSNTYTQNPMQMNRVIPPQTNSPNQNLKALLNSGSGVPTPPPSAHRYQPSAISVSPSLQSPNQVNSNVAARVPNSVTRPDVIDLSSPPASPVQQQQHQQHQQQHHQQQQQQQQQQHQQQQWQQRQLQPQQQQQVHWQQQVGVDEVRPWNLNKLPDTNVVGVEPMYKMQKSMVVNRYVPVINAKPYSFTSELMMTVSDLRTYYFPSATMERIQHVLQEVLKIRLFAGNAMQMQVLKENNKCRTISDVVPLIRVEDVNEYNLQVLMYTLEGDDGEQSAAKRQRTS